ncbi:hypothetical protein ACFFL1_16630 [Samsonia erythrinae]|uniref:hypothetical protein n=1 Tax=Samsonia erythrinae TaxID=160434 RepID=UPI0018AD2FFD|nr:hypothetical protein [Samsonia erythrinae]
MTPEYKVTEKNGIVGGGEKEIKKSQRIGWQNNTGSNVSNVVLSFSACDKPLLKCKMMIMVISINCKALC